MIKLWEYEQCDKIRLTDNDGGIYDCIVIDVTDAEDQSDLGKPEDSITIKTDGGEFKEFYQTEVANITRI